jgi:N4-gp56 family major capsid protein
MRQILVQPEWFRQFRDFNSPLRSIQSLADTTTSTSNISEIQGQIWAAKVIQFGEANRKFINCAIVNTDLIGSGDKTVTIPKATSHLDIDTAKSAGEGGLRDTTELSNLRGVDISVAASNFEQGAITISKEIALTSKVDLVKQARYAIAQDLEDNVDSAIATELQDSTVTQRVFGGSGNSDPSTLATGDVISTDLVADAMAEIEDDDFHPQWLYIGPEQIKAFRKDPQFINASEYGSDKVVLSGEIGEYLGLKVIVSSNTPSFASGATDTNQSTKTWGAAGRCCIMVGAQRTTKEPVAVAVAWKEKPTIGYEWDKKRNKHWIYLDQAYNVGIIQPKAVCLIKVTNS